MTAYAPSDVRAVNLPGGCGEQHVAGDLGPGQRFQVDCDACEPLLTGNPHLGWATDVLGVTLTPDERAALDADKAQADRAASLAMQVFGAQLANLTKAGTLPTEPAVMPAAPAPAASLDDLTDEDLAALRARLEKAAADRAAAAQEAGAGPAGTGAEPDGSAAKNGRKAAGK